MSNDEEIWSEEESSSEIEKAAPDDNFPSDGGIDAAAANVKLQDAKSEVSGLRHIMQMREQFGLDEVEAKRDARRARKKRLKLRKREMKSAAHAPNVIQTLAVQQSGNSVSQVPEVVVYADPRKKKKHGPTDKQMKKSSAAAAAAAAQSTSAPLTTMKEARFDVFRFGVSGLDGGRQKDARIAHAVRLGAKPPKNQCLPYAEYKDKIKAQREDVKQRKEQERLSGMKHLTASGGVGGKAKAGAAAATQKKGKKISGGGGGGGGQQPKENIGLRVGRFDGGMLKLNAKDLAKIKGVKNKR